MQTSISSPPGTSTARYARCIETSKRIRWDIDRDVLRGRRFDLSHRFLPDSLSLADELEGLNPAQQRFVSQVQGRTYANMFGLVERYISIKMLEMCRSHGMGDQVAMEALVRFTDEELKHQELFRRIEALAAERMPAGYTFQPDPNAVAEFVLGKCTWAVLALTCHIELFTQTHYRASIGASAEGVSELYQDVFLYHWKEESQHAMLDELEWLREDARLTPEQRDTAVDDLMALVAGVDGILQTQAAADTTYVAQVLDLPPDGMQTAALSAVMLKAYRWQYIVSGVQEPRFQQLLGQMLTEAQMARVMQALQPLLGAQPRMPLHRPAPLAETPLAN